MSDLLMCQSVSKHFGKGEQRVEVLDGIDLAVSKGESVAIVGVSGSGKSTLLHLLGGLDKPSSGRIFFDGNDITEMDELQRCSYRNQRIGFVYQFHHLLGDFNVLENVMMPLRIQQRKTKRTAELAQEMLEQVGLSHRIKHRPHELSGGERQRVALCRAWVTQPDIVLADEPTGQLDQENAEKVVQLMVKLNQDFAIALVVATHDQVLTERFDRTYRLTK